MPDVGCIAKAQGLTLYEFGVNAVMRANKGLAVGTRSMPEMSCDEHTLYEQIEHVGVLTDHAPKVDHGSHGVAGSEPHEAVSWCHARCLTKALKRPLKHHQVVEPMIGHSDAEGMFEKSRSRPARATRRMRCATQPVHDSEMSVSASVGLCGPSAWASAGECAGLVTGTLCEPGSEFSR